jgi:hypothetical protein
VTAITDAVKLATGLDIDVKINSDTPLTGEPEQA